MYTGQPPGTIFLGDSPPLCLVKEYWQDEY